MHIKPYTKLDEGSQKVSHFTNIKFPEQTLWVSTDLFGVLQFTTFNFTAFLSAPVKLN